MPKLPQNSNNQIEISMVNYEEKELTEENKDDVFTCQDCKKETIRGEIRKIFTKIPFCMEDAKQYYCGCNGWE